MEGNCESSIHGYIPKWRAESCLWYAVTLKNRSSLAESFSFLKYTTLYENEHNEKNCNGDYLHIAVHPHHTMDILMLWTIFATDHLGCVGQLMVLRSKVCYFKVYGFLIKKNLMIHVQLYSGESLNFSRPVGGILMQIFYFQKVVQGCACLMHLLHHTKFSYIRVN